MKITLEGTVDGITRDSVKVELVKMAAEMCKEDLIISYVSACIDELDAMSNEEFEASVRGQYTAADAE
jgi:hypothetical protein